MTRTTRYALDALAFCLVALAFACSGGAPPTGEPAPLLETYADAAHKNAADAAPADAAPDSAPDAADAGAPACPPSDPPTLFAMADGGVTTTYVARYHVAEDGDSITANAYLTPTQVSYASLATELAGTDVASTMIATGGITMADCDARFAQTVIPAFASGGPKKIVTINAGTNDLKVGATPQATYDHLAHYCAQARAAGITTIVIGLLPAMWTSDAVNDAYRDLERTSAPGTCDFYVEPDAAFQVDLNLGHHPNRAWAWTFDGVHPNTAGEWLQAVRLLPVLRAAILSLP